jgi:Tol biopolymer transport system component
LLLSNGIGEDVPLWAAPTDGGEPRRIGDAAGHTAAWSPDGKQIVFGRGSALFTVNSDGSGLRKLLDTPGKPSSVRWAPTALRYAVTVSVDKETLWEARPAGAHAHLFLPNWDSSANPVYFDDSGEWMAGGKYYLFRAARWEFFGIYAVKEGHRFPGFFDPHPVLIYTTPAEFHCTTPSPDAKRVFFISGQGRSQFVRYDGERREFVPFLPGKSGKWASLSPDGRWVAYTSGDPNAGLWRSRSDGGEAVLLTPPSMDVYEPHWSPDGAWIVFSASLAGQPFNAYAISSAGGSPQKLPSSSSTPASNYPSWSPDGRSVLFRRDPPHGVSGRGLYLMDWRTKQISFVPQSEDWMQGTWSPDAKYIAGTDGSQIQVFDMRTHRWAFLARGKGLGPPLWSRSGKYIYYQDEFETEQPIFRASISGGKIERMMSSRQIPQADLTRYSMACLGPDDAPVATVRRNNAEIYALELELP